MHLGKLLLLGVGLGIHPLDLGEDVIIDIRSVCEGLSLGGEARVCLELEGLDASDGDGDENRFHVV